MSKDSSGETNSESESDRDAPHGEFRVFLGASDDTRGDAAADDEPPETSRYDVRARVAEGGMGVIFEVFDRSLGRTVAMKLIKDGPPRSGERRDGSGDAPRTPRSRDTAARWSRFLEEARVTGQLEHPGIVPVHELGVCDGRAYFTMPLVKGKCLDDVIALARRQEDGWNRTRVLGVLIKVCQAVAYAHARGIVHRDLKPANVMVGRFGETYVLDWGLAKVRGRKDPRDLRPRRDDIVSGAEATEAKDTEAKGTEAKGTEAKGTERAGDSEGERIESDSSLVTMDGTVLGTPAFMAPEQAAGKTADVDHLSDVYALGAMLYQLLTGQAPFVPAAALVSPHVVLARALEGPPRPIEDIDARVPPELVAICEKAMARRKSDRYPGSFELAEDLQAFLDQRVVRAYRTGAVAELRKWTARHRTLLGSVGAAAAVLAIAALATYWVVRHREARIVVGAGHEHLASYELTAKEIARLEAEWRRSTPEEDWFPVWRRTEELRAHAALEAARQNADTLYQDALRAFESGLRLAPPWSVGREARAVLERLYAARHEEILRGGTIAESPHFYATRLEELGRAPRTSGTIRLRSVPGSAAVYCFRYEEHDAHLLPLPFDPRARRVAGEPFLRVEKVWRAASHQGVFAAGDRLVSVRGEPIHRRTDLARSLEGLKLDEEVKVIVERLGTTETLSWMPFPRALYEPPEGRSNALPSGTLLDIREQLGLTFEGYPLDFVDACRIETASEDGLVEVELPRGSYLLVFRRSGYRDTRYPVVIPWWRADEVATVRLLAEEEIPPDFLHVPAGPFSYGGDANAFQSLESGETTLEGFFIGRHEVTFAEYIAFLNAPDAGVSESGTVDIEDADAPRADGNALDLLPRDSRDKSRTLVAREDGRWTIAGGYRSLVRPGSPLLLISQLAATEYARWRTKSSGGKWRYRLPSDLEWEKAARGVDRRTFVWGNYLVWSFCWSLKGTRTNYTPYDTGMFPLDESVYGVRDLAGSVEEFSASEISSAFIVRRGGDWNNSDRENFHAANRNGRVAHGRGVDTGIRLVAEPAAGWPAAR